MVAVGPVDALRFLAAQGVDLSAATDTGKTALDFALHGAGEEGAYVRAVAWLRERLKEKKKTQQGKEKVEL